MRLRVAALAVLLLLAVAFAAALLRRPAEAPVRMGKRPVTVLRTLSPRDPQFGDTVVATVEVTVDPRRVDPETVRVLRRYAPYRVVASTRTVDNSRGVSITRIEDRLRCLDLACVPPGDNRAFRFPAVRVSYPGATAAVAWPALHVHSRVAADDLLHPAVRVGRPEPEPDYRLPPRPTGYALLAAALALALAGVTLLLRVGLRRLEARRPAGSPLERILGELAAASSNGDSGRRRRALEELARELRPLDEPLSRESRVLAWAEPEPQRDEIVELASRVRAVVSA